MSRNNSRKKQQYLSFSEIQTLAEDYKRQRDELNKKTKEIFNELKAKEKEIDQFLNEAKELRNKRDEINKKVQEFKKKKIELIDKIKNLSNQRNLLKKKDKESGKQYSSIRRHELEIERLERRIETDVLTIKEENRIIERINDLNAKRKDLLKFMEEHDELFQIEKDIDATQIELDDIKEQLDTLSKESQEFHEQMITLFKETDYLRDQRKAKEDELIENKKKADEFHELYIKMMNQQKKVKRPKKPYLYKKQLERKMAEQEMIKKQLESAIEKRKKGEKLNLFEARLLLEHENKEK